MAPRAAENTDKSEAETSYHVDGSAGAGNAAVTANPKASFWLFSDQC